MEMISECTVERVTAHTEFGPACELREQVLSRSSATWYASRNAGEGDTCEIGVHELYIDAQLPVENPMLEYACTSTRNGGCARSGCIHSPMCQRVRR